MKLSDLPKLKPLIEAVERGETIQVCQDGIWIDCKGYNYEFMDWQFDYRIKPKPREWYEVAFDSAIHSSGVTDIACRYATYEEALKHTEENRRNHIIKVREVLDD